MSLLKQLASLVAVAVLAFLLVCCFPNSSFAGTTGKIAGRVLDGETGEPLPGANVVIQGTSLGAATDVDGYFTILRVPPGTYNVEVSMIGYKKVIQTNVIVRVDLTTQVNYSLEATVVQAAAVEIVAEQPLVIKDLTSSATKISAREIEDVPNVNSVTDAVALMPGVIGEGEEIHVRGGRAGEVVYMIDGVAVNDPLFNNEVIDVNKYAVEEVELITGGYNAEYGNVQSGVVNIVPRVGSTKYSGRIAYFTDDLGSGSFPSDLLNDAAASNPDNPFAVLDVDPQRYFKPRGTGLRTNSFNTDRWEFNFGGPEPLTNSILPALGLTGLRGKVNLYLSATAEMSDGYLPNEDQSADLISYEERFTRASDPTAAPQEPGEADISQIQFVNPHKVKHPFMSSFLGLFDWGGRFDNNLNYSAVLTYRPGTNYKANVSFVGSKFWRDDYRHSYKFQPDHTQQFEGTNLNTVFTWTHNLSNSTFYEFKFAYLRNDRFQYPGMRNGVRLSPFFMNNRIEGLAQIDGFAYGTDLYTGGRDANGNFIDDGDGDDELFNSNFINSLLAAHPELDSIQVVQQLSGFFRTGWNGASTWSKHLTQVYTLKLDVTSQVTRNHQLKGGFIWKLNNLKQSRIDFGGNKVPSRRINIPDEGPFVTSGALRDFYNREPNTGAAYLQDKIEFQSLIINVGLRFDHFDPGSEVFKASISQGDQSKKPVKDKNYLSPRLGISHPITDRSTLYFFYGRFVQIPPLSELYRRQNRFRVFQNQLNTFGNPDLKAEETISYEVGFDHQLTDDLKIGVTGFFKENRNQINLATFGPEAAPFRMLVNRDFGRDRGFEIELIKRYSHYFSANINYTLSWADTRSSTFDRGIGAQGVASFPNVREVPANWDQRHTLNANISFEVPAGHGFKLFGTTIDRMGLNTFIRYGSGLPFTVNEDADPFATENAERLPYFLTVDLRFRKDFRLYRGLLASFYVDVNNLFNRRNLLALVGDAEHSCVECTLPVFDPQTGAQVGTVTKTFKHGNPAGDGTPADLNPEQFGAPRQILFGLGMRF